MRKFNTFGPVNENEHYVVVRRPLIAKLMTEIEQGRYFTIFAPRQTGKTTFLYHLRAELRTHDEYLPFLISFEHFEGWSAENFRKNFAELICQDILDAFHTSHHPNAEQIQSLLDNPPVDIEALWYFFHDLYKMIPGYKLIFIIDEFDATPQEALSSLLHFWRRMYLDKRPPHNLHSVLLVGIQNIARLNLGRSSPFNIAYQYRLEGFSLAEVQDLLGQYTSETAQPFTDETVEKIYEQTAGQPFLVNRLAAIVTEQIAVDRTKPVTLEDLEVARQRLLTESNYNFEAILRRANEHYEDMLEILFGAKYEFNLNDPLVHELYMHGVISKDGEGYCQIANPIYAAILLAAFRPQRTRLQAETLVNGYDFRQNIAGHTLQIGVLLSRFRQFVERRGREAFKVTPMPQEATGQYLLLAYLDLIVRQLGGDLFTEVYSGEGRLDLLVTYQGQRFVVETKVWRGQIEFDKGLEQLRTYLVSEGQQVGYYVVFHARPKVYGALPMEQLEFTTQLAGVTIHVYLVRLGEIFEE